MANVGKNQTGSVSRLWYAMACQAPSGPDQLPDGVGLVRLQSSLRDPDGRLRSTRPPPDEMALSVAVPDSSSEPAMWRAVPTRVISEMEALPTCTARDRWRTVVAEMESEDDCWAVSECEIRSERKTPTYPLAKCMMPPDSICRADISREAEECPAGRESCDTL